MGAAWGGGRYCGWQLRRLGLDVLGDLWPTEV